MYHCYCTCDFICSYAHCDLQNLYRHLLRASRQWRDLNNRMQSGVCLQSVNEVAQDGAMAIFCPACPQPGINLPDDWQARYRNREWAGSMPIHCAAINCLTEMSSYEHSSWMGTSLQSTWSPGLEFPMFHSLQEWPSWPILFYTRHISTVAKRLLRYLALLFWCSCLAKHKIGQHM